MLRIILSTYFFAYDNGFFGWCMGRWEGRGVGCEIERGVGFDVGRCVGRWEGRGVGCEIGRDVGRGVGRGVGRSVGLASMVRRSVE